jgi:hypothetical protein
MWWNHMVIPEGHVLATLSIVRKEPLLSRGINQAFMSTMSSLQTCPCLLASLAVLLYPASLAVHIVYPFTVYEATPLYDLTVVYSSFY